MGLKDSLLKNNLGFSGGSVVKNPPANAGDVRDEGSIPSREDPLEKERQPIPDPCLGNPMDRGT